MKRNDSIFTGRRLALTALTAIEEKEAFANRILNSLFLKYRPEERERGFATELVYGTLRHLALVDHCLAQLLAKPLSVLPGKIRNILRLSLYQLLVSPEIAYAVVDEAVSLAKQEAGGKLAGLVNAVLRRYLREKETLSRPQMAVDPLGHLTIVHSHPEWLIKRWVRRWGMERVHELARINNLPAPFMIRTNTLRITRDRLQELLAASGLTAVPSSLTPEALLLTAPRNLQDNSLFAAGYYFIQDEASMLVAHLVAPQPGETIVDLCAAPGGKTTHLAQLMKDEGRIFALDNHPHKTRLIEENATRLGITSITTVTADAREWRGDGLEPDAVLLDAPCTGTGVLRRRPDIRWRRTAADLSHLVLLQEELLENAAALLRPGGRLIYSTCSLEAEEDEEQIKKFLRKHPEFSVEIEQDFASGFDLIRSPSGLLLFPSENGADGFFMTKLRKRGK